MDSSPYTSGCFADVYGMESGLRSSVSLWSVIWVRVILTVAVPGRQETRGRGHVQSIMPESDLL